MTTRKHYVNSILLHMNKPQILTALRMILTGVRIVRKAKVCKVIKANVI
jgi:hypothetical protein